jgi:hypothetical protein
MPAEHPSTARRPNAASALHRDGAAFFLTIVVAIAAAMAMVLDYI